MEPLKRRKKKKPQGFWFVILISPPDALTPRAVGAVEQMLDYRGVLFLQSAKCKLVYPVCASVCVTPIWFWLLNKCCNKNHTWTRLRFLQMSVGCASGCYDGGKNDQMC